MPNILEHRDQLRPIVYEDLYFIYDTLLQETWSHHKIQFDTDLVDWTEATELTRAIVGGILRTFTQAENTVGCFWRNVIAQEVQSPEARLLATMFAHHESIHLISYDKMDATLGIDSYAAFQQDAFACQKLGAIVNKLDTHEDLALSLAIFSAFVEGVSLFSSFAILLSFTKDNKFKGLAGVLSYSISDEMIHSSTGIKIYQQLIKEQPELAPAPEAIYEGCDLIVQNEVAFIKNIFKGRNLPNISEAEAVDFIYYRANLKLMELKLIPQYELSGDYKKVKFFFDSLTRGKVLHDFFVTNNNGTGYTSTVKQDFLNL